jgi:hypothetical protein
VAKLVARLLATAALFGFEPRHLSKIPNGRHKQRSGKQLYPSKKIYKNQKKERKQREKKLSQKACFVKVLK